MTTDFLKLRNSGGAASCKRHIVATCNGDICGAPKALLPVNEQLEAELVQAYAAVAHGGLTSHGSNVLH